MKGRGGRDFFKLSDLSGKERHAEVDDAVRVVPVGRKIVAQLGGVSRKHLIKNGDLL